MPVSELLVTIDPVESRSALIEDGVLREFHIEQARSRSIVGDIYLGRVDRVLRGMQAAFIDIGLERHAFLQVADTVRPDDLDALATAEDVPPSRRVSKDTPISQVLKTGQPVVVQVTRAPVGQKGARVTSHISLAGRHLVYLPTLDRVGVSRRIQDDEERHRLTAVVDVARKGGGVIVRTAAEGASEQVLLQDLRYLTRLWAEILENRSLLSPPVLLHGDLDLTLRTARDLLGAEVRRMVVDEPETFERLKRFVRKFLPDQAEKLELYQGGEALFDAFGVEEGIKRALARVIPLPSGGSLVIDHAEALTAIDVNSGRFAGGKDLEETITRTNLEAVKEVAYQLRLRNIGGLIVVDFIDMDRPANREKVNRALQEVLRDDRARTTAVRISELGLVEMTRKGATQSLNRLLHEPCFYCEGIGQLRHRITVGCDIIREIRRRAHEHQSPLLVVECHPEVAKVLSNEREHRQAIRELEQRFGIEVEVRARDDFHFVRFDIKGGGRDGSKRTT